MAAKKNKRGMEFILEALKKNRDASYKDIADAAKKKRLTIYPIMFGRAQALLGIVKLSPRGQGKMARAKAAKSSAAKAGAKRGPGRPPKAAAPALEGTLAGIVAAVKGSEQSKARYRRALERIQEILAEALAD